MKTKKQKRTVWKSSQCVTKPRSMKPYFQDFVMLGLNAQERQGIEGGGKAGIDLEGLEYHAGCLVASL